MTSSHSVFNLDSILNDPIIPNQQYGTLSHSVSADHLIPSIDTFQIEPKSIRINIPPPRKSDLFSVLYPHLQPFYVS